MKSLKMNYSPMNDIISQLKRHEGFRGKMYTDSAGVSLIGYGIDLEHGISECEASFILEETGAKVTPPVTTGD